MSQATPHTSSPARRPLHHYRHYFRRRRCSPRRLSSQPLPTGGRAGRPFHDADDLAFRWGSPPPSLDQAAAGYVASRLERELLRLLSSSGNRHVVATATTRTRTTTTATTTSHSLPLLSERHQEPSFLDGWTMAARLVGSLRDVLAGMGSRRRGVADQAGACTGGGGGGGDQGDGHEGKDDDEGRDGSGGGMVGREAAGGDELDDSSDDDAEGDARSDVTLVGDSPAAAAGGCKPAEEAAPVKIDITPSDADLGSREQTEDAPPPYAAAAAAARGPPYLTQALLGLHLSKPTTQAPTWTTWTASSSHQDNLAPPSSSGVASSRSHAGYHEGFAARLQWLMRSSVPEESTPGRVVESLPKRPRTANDRSSPSWVRLLGRYGGRQNKENAPQQPQKLQQQREQREQDRQRTEQLRVHATAVHTAGKHQRQRQVMAVTRENARLLALRTASRHMHELAQQMLVTKISATAAGTGPTAHDTSGNANANENSLASRKGGRPGEWYMIPAAFEAMRAAAETDLIGTRLPRTALGFFELLMARAAGSDEREKKRGLLRGVSSAPEAIAASMMAACEAHGAGERVVRRLRGAMEDLVRMGEEERETTGEGVVVEEEEGSDERAGLDEAWEEIQRLAGRLARISTRERAEARQG